MRVNVSYPSINESFSVNMQDREKIRWIHQRRLLEKITYVRLKDFLLEKNPCIMLTKIL